MQNIDFTIPSVAPAPYDARARAPLPQGCQETRLQPDYIWSPEDDGKSSKPQISGQKPLPSWRGGRQEKEVFLMSLSYF